MEFLSEYAVILLLLVIVGALILIVRRMPRRETNPSDKEPPPIPGTQRRGVLRQETIAIWSVGAVILVGLAAVLFPVVTTTYAEMANLRSDFARASIALEVMRKDLDAIIGDPR